MAQQCEGDTPLVAVAGHGGSFLVKPNDAAQTLDEVAPFEAHGVAERKVRAPQWPCRFRWRRLARVKLDRRIGHPPVLGRVLSQYQELIRLELGDAAMLHPIVAQVPEVDFLADMQALAHCQDARRMLQRMINGGPQTQQIEVRSLLLGTHQVMQIHSRMDCANVCQPLS